MKNTDTHLDRLGDALHRAAAADLDAATAEPQAAAPFWRRSRRRLALVAPSPSPRWPQC